MTSHDPYTELVVGYALDALEPGDEQALRDHLPGCEACRLFLTQMREVAGSLAYNVVDEAPPGDLVDKIRDAIAVTPQDAEADRSLSPRSVSTPREADPGLEIVGQRQPPPGAARHTSRLAVGGSRTGRRVLAIAAALILVLGIAGVAGYAVHVSSERNTATAALRAEQAVMEHLGNPGAYSVPLGSGGAASGSVVVDGQQMFLISRGLAKNDTSNSIYVMWAGARDGSMVAVGSFDVKANGQSVERVTLPSGVSGPTRFGVTHESGRTAPVMPGATVLGGQRT